MNILDILQEAKDPEKKTVLRAVTQNTKEAEDYSSDDEVTAANEEDTNDEPSGDVDDTTDDDTNDNQTDENDDTPDEETGTDYTDEVSNEDDSTDDISDDNSSDDESTDDSETNELSEDNRILLNDMVYLYYNIKNNIDKLDSLEFLDIISCKIIIESKQQMTKLMEYTYNYITLTFNTKKYSENLYAYKYIVELYALSLEMLKKISTFTGNT